MAAPNLVHVESVIAGQATLETSTINIDGDDIAMKHGFPAGTALGIVKLIPPNQGWKQKPSTGVDKYVYWHGSIDEDASVALCFLRYSSPTSVNA
ncbi:MAG: hypothetical protein ACPGUD_12420 [Parashewanella sp.]